MIRVQIQTAGITKLAAKADRRLNFLGSGAVRAILQQSAGELVEAFQENIEAMTPGRVPDLKDSTKKKKLKKYGSVYPILKATHSMFNSMTAQVFAPRGNGWVIRVAFPGSDVDGGSNADKAKAHIEGTATLPKRDFTTIPRKWRTLLFQRIRAALRR